MKKDALIQKHQKVEMVKRDIMKKTKEKENKTNRNIKTTNAQELKKFKPIRLLYGLVDL